MQSSIGQTYISFLRYIPIGDYRFANVKPICLTGVDSRVGKEKEDIGCVPQVYTYDTTERTDAPYGTHRENRGVSETHPDAGGGFKVYTLGKQVATQESGATPCAPGG